MKGPITLVTTTGLARTCAQVGMIEILAERGIVADHVVGTSLGAINAASVAAGVRAERLRDFWFWLETQIAAVPVRTITRSMSSRYSRKQQDVIRARIETLLPTRFDRLGAQLELFATDLGTGSAVVLDAGELIPAVMASGALPGVMPPVDLGQGPLIDGGLVAGMPLGTVGQDVGTIIILDTGHASVSAHTAAGFRWWEVGAMSYAHLIRGQAVHALTQAAAVAPVVLISTDVGNPLDFTDADMKFAAGREAATACLDGLPEKLKRGIYGLPAGLDDFEVLQALRAG